jgi:CBS domain-containing protein
VNVQDAMTSGVLTITPARTLRDAARVMTEHNVGALVVLDPEQPGPGIVSERDVVRSVSAGGDPHRELVRDHLTPNAIFAGCDWPLEDAAATMTAGGFRHLVVLDGGELVGIISMRDIVRAWGAEPTGRPWAAAAISG